MDQSTFLWGGTPCQSFSVAGLRKGLADPRGNLALAFLGLADRARAEWLVWENVPGVLSVDGGRAFGAFLGGLGQLGYGWAYRVLDAQYFGLAQRRARVFLVARLGDWRAPTAVLFERESLRGDPAPSREAGADVASAITRGLGSGGADDNKAQGNHLVSNGTWGTDAGGDVARPLTAPRNGGGGSYRGDVETDTLVTHSLRADDAGDVAPTLRAMEFGESHANGGGQVAVAMAVQEDNQNGVTIRDTAGSLRADAPGSQPCGSLALVAPSLTAFNMDSRSPQSEEQQRAVAAVHAASSMVRRLTPRECERLQGFPDDYTLVPYRGKPAADGPRYRAIRNSWAIPCVEWIARRMDVIVKAPL